MTRKVTAWVGWIWFAGLIMLSSGVFNVLSGIYAVGARDVSVVEVGTQILLLDVNSWGWVHIAVGALLVLVAICLLAGQFWARLAAVIVVGANMVTQFLYLPLTPWWSIVVLALDVVVLWALIVHGEEAESAS
ncbi:hypothetical protein EXU48_06760 [Occultella glacieicola]|uniref:DUF7144 domain-containing protein n=1 Tax=Occultella glacieicola TaxID=2518684 RepID=A0ABY2E5S7_9MICO|nr:hypothetical protein [Occultella glacieicola]TDE95947.1 hypothetical protein EXU48_06760 [Occultella glacieicola]